MMNKHFLLLLQIVVVLLFATLMVVEAQALCVSSKFANLRSRPSTKSPKTWKVVKYMPFQKIKSTKGWYRVRDVDGDYHWLFAKLATTKYKCAVVKAKKANLRTSPGGKVHKKYTSAEKYVTFRYLGRKGSWAKVVDEQGTKFWIARSLIWIQ